MIEPRADRPQAVTLAADKAYDAEDFINELRAMKVTPMWRRTRVDAVGGRRPHDATRRLRWQSARPQTISKRGNKYLRKQLIHGAGAALPMWL